ncbi:MULTISPECIES: hypothetical protein [Leptolyngbya]|uniref:hypothetical protein n=1 Tax=Leptolyngbya TaxID=47251 RepID=UPI00168399E3|nr:hypothetical protein [Leptolyngbya sp. FACHB-1624]MBD1857944.1 hypothetical protein [Leptolyngbya sp. FACHB-1624]
MPEFEDFRTALNQARTQKQQAHLDLFKSQERQQQIQAELDQLAQIFDPKNQEHVARQQRLNRAAIQARGTVQANQERYDRNFELESSSFERFKTLLLDPRQQVERLSDDYPILLLPLRLETRFKTITTNNTTRTELWVRVYPDDCAIDTFEPLLSQSELKNAQTYWTQSWQAGGREDQERAAWRGLVSSHGSGRSRWILDRYRPMNLDQKPTFDAENTPALILTIPTDNLPPEADALKVYWESVWRLNGETEQTRNTLNGTVGAARAEVLIQHYIPNNLTVTPQSPLTKENASITVDFVVFPNAEDVAVKQLSWSQAPKTTILPDCFVLIGQAGDIRFEQVGRPIPSPLVVGPDPNAPPDQQLRQENGELLISDEMRWMVDFERAVEWGMGFKVPLDAEQARNGLDRLMVLGLKLSADEKAGQTQLETLLQHHHWGRSGLSILPQGTPTNNTDQIGAGFSRAEDADASYDSVFGTTSTDDPFAETDMFRKRDGQWLAEALGIDPQILRTVPNCDRTDQTEARAMNTALWSATLGYSLETMLHPVLTDSAVDDTRWFFNRFVSGRGSIPALRIGRQPYGILPTTAFSQIQWVSPERLPKLLGTSKLEISRTFLSRLYEILQIMDADWAAQVAKVSWVGKPGDAHKTLLDIVGLHASSVEYYQRYAESLQQLFNRLNLQGGLGGQFFAALIAAGYTQSGLDLLQKLGYRGEQTPDVLQKFFLSSQNLMKGAVIDDRPLSEVDPIRSYTADRKNYIQWLQEAASTSLETLRQQQGFLDNKAPNALLYLFLRHALLLGYWDVSWRLHRGAEVLSVNELDQLRREPNFVHVKTQANTSESRWQLLYKTEARITGEGDRTIADFIPQALTQFTFETRYLNDQLRALEHLKDVPTARLERLFAEHIDCCTYRLDAWKLGLVNFQWMAMRSRSAPAPTPTPAPLPIPRFQQEAVASQPANRRGIYLGAYGWLENIRPENKVLTPKNLSPELTKIFDPASVRQPPVTAPQRKAPAARVVSRSTILQDNQNAGYIHAPSLNHAVTAAVLRNGYLSTAQPDHRKTLAVNLSSERVRVALAVLEGIREGQSLGALLGYQLERGLHDRHNMAEVDQFIFKLRKAFPLRADRLSPTRTDPTVPIEAIEARNVLDGLSLVNHVKRQTNPAQRVYPFGKALPSATSAQAAAINAEVDRLLNLHDAVADLALAEGVHQAVQGNYDRAAATLDTYSKGNFPPEPEVVQTPRSGITLTHRVGLQLQPGLDSTTSPIAGLPMTPRAQAEPALNHWLALVLPEPERVACRISYRHPVTNAVSAPITVTQQDLGLQPIDLLYLNQTDSQAGMGELDDRLRRWLFDHPPSGALRPDTAITLHYTERIENKVSFFEVSALLNHLRSLILRSQPLKASDVTPPTSTQSQSTVIDQRPRLEPLVTSLQNELTNQLLPFRNLLQGLLADLEGNRSQILSQIDSHLNTFITRMAALSIYGLPQTGWGLAYDQKRQIFESILEQVRSRVNLWQERQQQFTLQLAAYDALPPETSDRDRTDALIALERLVASTPTSTPPASLADYRSAIVNQSTLFANQLSSFQAILTTSEVNLAPLLSSLQVSIADFDVLPLDLSAPEQQIIALTEDLLRIVTAVAQDIVLRLQTIQTQFTTYDNSANPETRLTAVQAVAAALFGDDFKLIPEFTLAPDAGASWQNAMTASLNQDLFSHLSAAGIDFPVDDWLYGIARVREKMRHWEQLVMLSGAFGRPEPELQPIQLPYRSGDPWLGLQFPENFQLGEQLKGDRLLYSAYYTVPFNPNQRQCGLLLDEWTEVIPGETETTGIAFHYDRPNSEPPQTWLFVTPPRATGNWQWSDLTGALIETLEMAKKRAVEPDQLDDTAYARFLPATIMAATLYQISISANLALNNKVHDFLLNRDS